MSVEAVLTRIAEIRTGLHPRPPPRPPRPAPRPSPASSASAAADAVAGRAAGAGAPRRCRPGRRAPGRGDRRRSAWCALAQAEVGQAEQPPGSNDSPRIAQYRPATAGSGVGPWCAYFVSWAAQQAGAPLGEGGQGFGVGRRALRLGPAHRPLRSPPAPARRRRPATSSSGAAGTSASSSPSAPTARSTPSRATPPTRSRAAPTAPTAAARRATCACRRSPSGGDRDRPAARR